MALPDDLPEHASPSFGGYVRADCSPAAADALGALQSTELCARLHSGESLVLSTLGAA